LRKQKRGLKKTLSGSAENILKVKEIPCNNRITRLIDGINPGEFDWNFREGPGSAEKYGVM
jgi:hypothetical protein